MDFSHTGKILPALFCRDTWRSISPCDILLYRHDIKADYVYQNKAYSPLLDSLAYFFTLRREAKISVVAQPWSHLIGCKAHNAPVSFNRQAFLSEFYPQVHGLIFGYDGYLKCKADARAGIWHKILLLAKPKIVIGINPDAGLCKACHRLNIPVFEIQHGAIGHVFNSRARVSFIPDYLPSGYLVFDQNQARILKDSVGEVTIRIIGNPWFIRFKLAETSDDLVHQSLCDHRIFNNSCPTILYSLQWDVYKIHSSKSYERFMSLAMENVIKKTSGKYNWMLRMHPTQMRGKERKPCEQYLEKNFGQLENVEWRKSSILPLPVILNQSHLHVTDCSSIVIEAGWMDIPSAMLNPEFKIGGKFENYYPYERKCGLAELIPAEESIIIDWVSQKLERNQAHRSFQHIRYSDELFRFIDEAMDMSLSDENVSCY